ncbi:beta-nerve growth factor-like [Megalops cyprinoides]|uniref:beta-nerve growth factor-like n=1 Tax=Megalops cyprinoides TaxID=118141 RepID=UPI00186427D8|nr:beta-nerve growth factor-like [Megalops cyprinoides]
MLGPWPALDDCSRSPTGGYHFTWRHFTGSVLMRSTTLVLLLLIGVQAAVYMGGGVWVQGKAQRDPTQSRSQGERGAPVGGQDPHSRTPLSIPSADSKIISRNPQSVSTVGPKLFNTTTLSSSKAEPKLPTVDPSVFGVHPLSNPVLEESSLPLPAVEYGLLVESPDSIPTVDPKIFNKRRYRSPRVLFSAHPPDADTGGPRAGSRTRRRAGQPKHRGVYSVCESISNWVGNKTKATDITGNEVTVLPDVRINNIVKKQYFFETTCRGARKPGPAGASCLGIDSRHWNSYCTNTHTFVLAMTSFKSLVAWRLIRINAACVCVLSRKSWRH